MTTYTPIDGPGREAADRFLEAQWGSPFMAVRGRLFDLRTLPGFIAWEDGAIEGMITFEARGATCEVLSLDSLRENRGVGSALLGRVVALARKRGCARVMVVTTNDNARAIRFYQRRGFDLTGLDRDAVTRARALKPSIPMMSPDGIPIRHELTFELDLTQD